MNWPAIARASFLFQRFDQGQDHFRAFSGGDEHLDDLNIISPDRQGSLAIDVPLYHAIPKAASRVSLLRRVQPRPNVSNVERFS